MAGRFSADTARFLFASESKTFAVVKFDAQEGISTLFSVRLTLAAEDEVCHDDLLGQAGTLTLEGEDNDRFFHGLIRRFEAAGHQGRFFLYQIELVPTVWLAGQQTDCRIFQNINTPGIVRKILTDIGLTAEMFSFRLQGKYAPREYCVQYRETNLNFICRLLEEEGIFFFFEFTRGNHIMVFGDGTINYQPMAGNTRLPLNAGGRMVAETESIHQFRRQQQILPGKYAHTDFNFEKPGLDLQTQCSAGKYGGLEIYDCPGDFSTPDSGKTLANIRLEQCRMHSDTMSGRSDCRRLLPGFTFHLTGHEQTAFNTEYAVVRVEHRGRQPQVLQELSGSQGLSYVNTFKGIPATVTIRPERRTPKPTVEGVQTAIVTGPPGEEIYPDKFGRVKVQFHWDRQGKRDEKSSCWIRVSQLWAGSGWGAMFIPRIGQEVIVDFLEGDPDRPIITGRVYHGANLPPYDLPAQKTKSTIKSNCSKGGQGCNEIRFEDQKGQEELFMQAQKDMNLHVKNDRKSDIGRDCHWVIHRDRLEKIERDAHFKVNGNAHREIGQDDLLKISGKSAREITGSLSLKVNGDVIESFQGNHGETVANGYKLKAANAVVEASANVTIKCGGSSIVLTPSGIFIQGPMVNVNSGAGPSGMVSTGQLVAPALPLSAVAVGAVTAGMSAGDAAAHNAPAHSSNEKVEEKKNSWVEIELLDEEDQPVAGERYRITLPDGATIAQGTTDDKGRAKVAGIDPGMCKVSFPDLDKDAWGKR